MHADGDVFSWSTFHRRLAQNRERFPLPLTLIVCALRGTLFLGAGLVLVQPCAGGSGVFENTGSLATARVHTATLLPNGKVLVAGGENAAADLASAELYDPASGTWTTTGSLVNSRSQHTATLLPNGKVLVAGGLGDGGPLASAELYDPASGTWTATGSLATARDGHTATLLPNGKVLVAGGFNGSYFASAELYDPVSGTWTATGSLATARSLHSATLLPNGKVLVAGGLGAGDVALASAELYDPASGTWTATGSLATARADHTATLLPNGKVLVAGRWQQRPRERGTLRSGERDLDGDRQPRHRTRYSHGDVAAQRQGARRRRVSPSSVALVSAELYDPASESWLATGNLATARFVTRRRCCPTARCSLQGT